MGFQICRAECQVHSRYNSTPLRAYVIITPEKLYGFTNEADDDLADLQFFFSKIQKRMNLKPMIRGEYTKAKNGGFEDCLCR